MPQRRRQTLNLLRAAMVGSVIIPVGLFAYGSWNTYRDIARATDDRIERNLDVLTEHAQKIFQSVEVAATAVDQLLGNLNEAEIEARQPVLHEQLKNIIASLKEVQSVWVFDAKGRSIVTSAAFPAPNQNYADRDYFSAHIEKEIGTYVGELLLPRVVITDPFFSISKRRKSAGGSFNGVIQFSLASKDISGFYDRISTREDSAFVSMVRADGNLLARHPGPLTRPTKLPPNIGFLSQTAKFPDGSIYNTRTILEPIETIRVGNRRIQGYPVYVSSGVLASTLNNQWLSTMGSHLVFGLPATLLLVGVIGLALRRSKHLYAEIDRREQAESALRQAQRMEAIGNLTGGIAHDFNNLLMVIMGNLEIAKKHLTNWTDASRPRLEKSVESATQGAQRAATLTQRLLAFARRKPLDPKPLNPNKLVGGISDLLRRALGETVDLEIVGAGGLWQVEADPAELESAILNLALNARDAMPGGGKLTIETGNAFLDESYAKGNEIAPGQYVMIAVSDTGTGMPKAVIERAFEPFFTTKESGQGTGLGLSQVYGFVKQSGGTVKIYSEPGLGTSVKIYLPRCTAAATELPEKIEEVVGGSAHEKILVVEDDEDVREFVLETLRELNYSVVGASSADQALSVVSGDNFKFDLLLTDVVLPGMNGRELADRIKVQRPDVPVLFMTGYSRNAIVHHGRLDPGVDLIQKPVTQEMLAMRVREMLDAKGVRG